MENHTTQGVNEYLAPGLHFIDIDGQKMRFEVSGSGEPLILMHGWGCRLETVRSIAQTASETHRVFNIDFPGFGESPEPSSVWGVEEYASFIEKFMGRLGLKRPVLIGHSFGGKVGILLASRNDISKMILVGSAGVKPKHSFKYYLKVYAFKAKKNLIKLFFGKKKGEEIIRKLRKNAGSEDYRNASDKMKAVMSKVLSREMTSEMPLIKAPTLLIWGVNDTATPMRDARVMESFIPGSGLVAFEDAGHYSFLDQPIRFRAVLSSFLNS